MSSKETKKNIQIVNRKAGFNFHIEERYEAGMVLLGGEVKSIRNNSVNMGDAYCLFEEGVLWVKNMHISEFRQSSFNPHDPMRNRKLLLKKQQLRRIEAKTNTKGYAIFPIRLFENERGILKLEIGLGQGKKTFDKRDDLKEKDIAREMQRSKI
ncbi:MAG: SsrA-binding protein SmpB [Flavobacteriaceae bacterium]|nr:SsrA-binding protein SmpB [Flavobacteriaceae bacterium]